MPDFLDVHYKMVIKAIPDSEVVPFLGAGVNLCGRPADQKWQQGQFDFVPSGSQLAVYLTKNRGYPPSYTQTSLRLEGRSWPKKTRPMASSGMI